MIYSEPSTMQSAGSPGGSNQARQQLWRRRTISVQRFVGSRFRDLTRLYPKVTAELLLLTVAPGCYHRALRDSAHGR
jgi:hypothetical protein